MTCTLTSRTNVAEFAAYRALASDVRSAFYLIACGNADRAEHALANAAVTSEDEYAAHHRAAFHEVAQAEEDRIHDR